MWLEVGRAASSGSSLSLEHRERRLLRRLADLEKANYTEPTTTLQLNSIEEDDDDVVLPTSISAATSNPPTAGLGEGEGTSAINSPVLPVFTGLGIRSKKRRERTRPRIKVLLMYRKRLSTLLEEAVRSIRLPSYTLLCA